MNKTDKRCSSCTETKPLTEFYKSTPQPDGHDAYCKECRKESQRQYHRNNPGYHKNYYRNVLKPRRAAAEEALRRLKELDPDWEPSA